MVSLESSWLTEGLGEPCILLVFPYCTCQGGSGAESSGPQQGAVVPLVHSKAPSGVLLGDRKMSVLDGQRRGEEGCGRGMEAGSPCTLSV